MNTYILYGIIGFALFILELFYFKIADKCNIIDKPNERSSHSEVVLRGGGIIFLIGGWIWSAFFGWQYPWFLLGLTLVAGISFVDDIYSLPDSVRLIVQFIAALLAFYQLDMLHLSLWWVVLLGLIVYVGITDVVNFMDGINGITGLYSIAVLLPILLLNTHKQVIDSSLLIVTIIAALVFSYFNCRPKGKAKCFAGDVGSIGVAYIMLFALTALIFSTRDITYLLFMVVYGIDACLTIIHRIMLHEPIGQAHRKHAYQIMANELGLSHIVIACGYAMAQLIISLVFVYFLPNTLLTHWIYLVLVVGVLSLAYVLFMKKYYHLHAEYLQQLNKK